jgi:TDG/mug DNA glycosylase family protein
MGEHVVTLADLLCAGLQAVVVGINPSPISVAAGHYYQGQIGQRFLARLVTSGVLDLSGEGFEDDQAFAQGIGFTDAVKRTSARADGLRAGELDHGRELLEARLEAIAAPRVIFTFKKAATTLLGDFAGHGVLPKRSLGGAQVFVMPGPMERTDRVDRALHDLRAWWDQ